MNNMGRQAFRRSKSDGTLDDGTGGGDGNMYPSGFGQGHSSFGWYETNPHIIGSSSNRSLSTVLSSGSSWYMPMYSYRGGTVESLGLAIETATSSTGALTLAIYDSHPVGGSLRAGYPKAMLGKITFASMDTSSGTLLQSSTWYNHSGSSIGGPELAADTWYWACFYWTGTNRNIRSYRTSYGGVTMIHVPLVATWGNGWQILQHSGQAPASSHSNTMNWGFSGPSYWPVLRFEYE